MNPEQLLQLTLRELLAMLVGPPAEQRDEWVDPRSEACPVAKRAVLDAGRRGELALRKVGRRVLVRRSELDRWIDAHPLGQPPAYVSAVKARETHMERLMRLNGYDRAPGKGSRPR